MKFDLSAFEEVDTPNLIQVTGGYYGTGGGYVSDTYVQQNAQNYTPTNGSVYGYNSDGTAKSPKPGEIDYSMSNILGYTVVLAADGSGNYYNWETNQILKVAPFSSGVNVNPLSIDLSSPSEGKDRTEKLNIFLGLNNLSAKSFTGGLGNGDVRQVTINGTVITVRRADYIIPSGAQFTGLAYTTTQNGQTIERVDFDGDGTIDAMTKNLTIGL